MKCGYSYNAMEETDSPKQWLIDSRCTSHLSPHKSDFITYMPYGTPRSIQLGNGSQTLLLGEGIIALKWIVGGKEVEHHFREVQYVPGMTHGLLSCRVLNSHRLFTQFGNSMCKITHTDGSLVAESLEGANRLYPLRLAPSSPSSKDSVAALAMMPSFNLLHKWLAHPGKDVLQMMIRKDLAGGLTDIPDDAKDFDCLACIKGKMVCG